MNGRSLERGELEERFLAAYPTIERYAARLIGIDQAEDVAQDTALSVHKALDKAHFTNEDQYRVWLMRITYNRCMDILRRRGLIGTIPLDVPGKKGDGSPPIGLINTLADSQLGPEEILLLKERSERLEEEVSRLSPRRSTALRMRFLEDLEYGEMAETLGTSLGGSRTRVFRGIAELRENLVVEDFVL